MLLWCFNRRIRDDFEPKQNQTDDAAPPLFLFAAFAENLQHLMRSPPAERRGIDMQQQAIAIQRIGHPAAHFSARFSCRPEARACFSSSPRRSTSALATACPNSV